MSLVGSTLDERTGIATLTINRPEALDAIDAPVIAAVHGAGAILARRTPRFQGR